MFAVLLRAGLAQDVTIELTTYGEGIDKHEIDVIDGDFSIELKNVSGQSIVVPGGHVLPGVAHVLVLDPESTAEYRICATSRESNREQEHVTLRTGEKIKYSLSLNAQLRSMDLETAFPETNTEKNYFIQAVFDTTSSEGKYWNGKVVSNSLQRQLIADGIKHPSGYMRERLFKDAQRLILEKPDLVNDESPGMYSNFPPLHAAASEGSPEMIQWLVDHGARVDYVNRYSPIYYATDIDSIKVLLDNGADPTIPGLDHSSGMSQAVRKITEPNPSLGEQRKWAEIFRLYCALGFELDLVSAIRLNDQRRIEQLLENSDQELQKYVRSQEVLRTACEFGRDTLVKRLVRSHGQYLNVNSLTKRRKFPVIAEALGHPKVFDILRLNGADLSCEIRPFGPFSKRRPQLRFRASLLQYAAIKGHPKVVELLLDKQPDPPKYWPIGESPLELAVNYGRLDNAATVLFHDSFQRMKSELRARLLYRSSRILTLKYLRTLRKWVKETRN